MNRLTGVLLGVLVTLADEAAAQGRGHMIAYDQCLYENAEYIACDVYLLADGIPNANPDGSRIIHIRDGAEPAWSRDGSRLAFAGSREAGIFVLNLGDWSLKKILNGGGSPTWAPDGTKLAIAAGELYVINADGSGLTELTSSVGFIGQPDWSPDGATIAFDCEIESGNLDICSINADGTGLARLTSEPEADSGAAFSPDGLTIAFTRTYGQSSVIASMNPDGTGMQTFFDGFEPAWSPGGMLATVHPWQAVCNADNICLDYIYVPTMNAEVFPRGNRPAWALSEHPVAWFVSQGCNELSCGFDGSGSWGGSGAVSHAWNFGDGASGTGPTPTHDYVAGGTYKVTLIVMDDLGVVGTQTRDVAVAHVGNAPPVASSTVSCAEVTCTFDASASSDSDGTIASYTWTFGDGTTGFGPAAAHTYVGAGAYMVTLTVTDNAGATDVATFTVTANAIPIASFTSACSGLTCSFNASGSSDPGGTITGYAWNFGNGTSGSGGTATRTYAAAGTYTVTLTVTDNGAATSTQVQNVTVAPWHAVTKLAYDQCWADYSNWEVVCDIHLLVDGSDTTVATGGVAPRWSPDGSRVAFVGNYNLDDVVVVNLADGRAANLTNHPARDGAPAWSRDGGRIAFMSDRDGSFELYVMGAEGANVRRLTYDGGFSGPFGWSPDGRIAFVSSRDGATDLYVMDADGSNVTRLTHDMGFNGQAVWSADGSRIAFRCAVESGDWDVCTINSDGTNFVHPPRPLVGGSGRPFGWDPAIAVMGTDGGVSRVDASIFGGQPAWSPDGSRLAFVDGTPSWYSGKCYFDEGAHNADDFCMAMYDIDVVNADGTGLTAIASGANPDWFIPLPGRPMAAFTYDCSGSTCNFDASGSLDFDGTIASHVWQFGDGTSGSGAMAGHTYDLGSFYIVTLTVTDDAGTSGVRSMRVYVNASPVASFSVVCSGPTCTFNGSGSFDSDGSITSYYWLFGDGEAGGPSAAHVTFTHTYRTGTFTARLIVRDNVWASSEVTQTLSVVNALPVASFTSRCSGLTCTLDASGSSDSDGVIAYLWWDFGDGGYDWHTVTTHTYATAGPHIVTLKVFDNGHQSVTHGETINVGNAPPIALFTSSCNGLVCSFNASGSSDPDGTIVNYAWTFGDGTTGSGMTVNRTYAAGGTYTVRLSISDNGNATSTLDQSVTVVQPAMHVGDLDRSKTKQSTSWTALVTISAHGSSHGPLANAVVSGSWNDGSTRSCTTNASGQCTVSKLAIPTKTSSVSFAVTSVARAAFVYTPEAKHDTDGDSNGSTITVTKP